MRNNKNNISFNVRNITLNYKILTFSLQSLTSFYRSIMLRLEILTNHFTGKEKIITLRFRNITLASIIIMLSFANMTLCSSNIFNNSNVSALDYSSNVGIGFTFNPTLSVSISPSDLIIDNLIPGSTLDSNSINVSVATNAAYGYTLSAIMDGDNSNLTHNNSIDTFSSIDPSANLETLTIDNTWGYTSKLGNKTTWNNYNGLSSSSNAILLDNSNAADSSGNIDFKISAKASNTQPSGEYTNTINFIAVTKVAPMSLLDSFIDSGAEQLNGYYKMQDMTHAICESVDVEESELQLIDIRDNKVYWVAKLKDGNCWMTQNLDLDLSSTVALTSETSDIDPESYGTTIYTAETGYSKDKDTGVVSWLPSTIDSEGIQRADTIPAEWNNTYSKASFFGWSDSFNYPYSANPGEIYRYTNSSTFTQNTYSSFEKCTAANNRIEACQHSHLGNYYNWAATTASNDISNYYSLAFNSICPKNWQLPNAIDANYRTMLSKQNVYSTTTGGNEYAENGFNIIRTFPLFFTQSGIVANGALVSFGTNGRYWSNLRTNANDARALEFSNSAIWPEFRYGGRYVYLGFSVRCIAK